MTEAEEFDRGVPGDTMNIVCWGGIELPSLAALFGATPPDEDNEESNDDDAHVL